MTINKISPSLFVELLKACTYSVVKRDHFGSHHAPDHLIVDSKIVMNQPVAHSGDRSPVHLWLCIRECDRKRLHGFTDDFEAPGEGPFQGWIRKKVSLTQLITSRQSISCLIQDMEQQLTH